MKLCASVLTIHKFNCKCVVGQNKKFKIILCENHSLVYKTGPSPGSRTRTRARRRTDGREAEDDVEVLLDAAQVVLVEVLVGRGVARPLLLHHRHQLLQDLVHLVAREQVGDLRGGGGGGSAAVGSGKIGFKFIFCVSVSRSVVVLRLEFTFNFHATSTNDELLDTTSSTSKNKWHNFHHNENSLWSPTRLHSRSLSVYHVH